jgi:hypothetical protein
MVKRDVLVSHVENLLKHITGNPEPERDSDGDWPFYTDRAVMYVRVAGESDPNISVWAVAAENVPESEKAYFHVNELNKSLRFSRAYISNGAVVFASELVGETLDAEELKNALDNLASAADNFGPQIVEECGGETLRTPQPDPPPERSTPESAGYL